MFVSRIVMLMLLVPGLRNATETRTPNCATTTRATGSCRTTLTTEAAAAVATTTAAAAAVALQ